MRVSKGAGRTNAQGETISVDDLAAWLRSLPAEVEGWWSPHTWRDAYRNADAWESSCAAVIDIDHNSPSGTVVPEADVERMRALHLPCNLFHFTPHGARAVFVFDQEIIDRDEVIAALRGACELVRQSIDGLPYIVDPCSTVLAQFYYTPRATAKGVDRTADVVVVNATPTAVSTLVASAPAVVPAVRAVATLPPVTRTPDHDYQSAVARFNAEHPLDIRRHSDTCPICEHNGCFGVLPNDNQRWWCWSTNHVEVGVRSPRGWHGDALDLYAHGNGVRPIDVLLREGYLAPRVRDETPTPNPDDDLVPQPNNGVLRPGGIHSNSFESACTVLRKESYPTNGQRVRGVLEGRDIRFNEMTGCIELGGREIRDVDAKIIRMRCESLYTGSVDSQGNPRGLKFGKDMVEDALDVVAHENEYHPVREYLSSLAWDCEPRIDRVVREVLGAEDTELNRAMLRKTLISAVARVFEPGCKVDTMLVFQGEQGAKKSGLFRALGEPWFIDTPVDISQDATRAYQVMRRAWVFEWAELETLLRARDVSTVKAFLSSQEDTYIAKYGRHPIVVKRSGIVCGSINPMHFLDDETGSRRIWPIRVASLINLRLAREWKDSLWAEAVSLYRDWVQRGRNDDECPWWLTREEEDRLRMTQVEHRVGDVWEDVIIPWAASQTDPFTTGVVLAKAIDKPTGQWNRGDENRVAKILKAYGYEKRSHGEKRIKHWFRKDAQTSLFSESTHESTDESTHPF